MKTYSHFSQSGAFAYLFSADSVPPIPLAHDGLPRTVEMQPAPTLGENEQAWPNRDGSWSIVATEPQVPQSVSKRQLRAACIHSGIMPEQIAAALAQIADPVARALAVNDWDCATEYERNHPMIAQMAGVFGLTAAQVDTLFIAAAKL